MKLIDLFIKIAKGEDTPEKIKYDFMIFTHDGDKSNNYYICKENEKLLEESFIFEQLNDEVEIIEDIPEKNKKIEKISLDDWVEFTTPGDIKRIDYIFNKNCSTFVDKINEVIEVLNKKQ